MSIYPKQCTERIVGDRFIEYQLGDQKVRSMVSVNLDGFQDHWDDRNFGDESFIGDICFKAGSEMKEFARVGRCVLLDGDRSLPLRIIEAEAANPGCVRVGTPMKQQVA